ncbi:DUF4254 domain-containing protein [Nocardia sp. CA-120079]|uniref:DUF4254 domain-containing protein n=1 Tax=Nocardia sp. CA-120079 TaxID=3239974 RepID=UPI003D96519E
MRTPLPSKDMILQACAGTVAIQHPVLQGAYELASLHEARLDDNADIGMIDRERDRLVSRIDSWVAADQPPASDAAYHHTETVGMVIDRLAQFAVDARVGAAQGTSTLVRASPHRARRGLQRSVLRDRGRNASTAGLLIPCARTRFGRAGSRARAIVASHSYPHNRYAVESWWTNPMPPSVLFHGNQQVGVACPQ